MFISTNFMNANCLSLNDKALFQWEILLNKRICCYKNDDPNKECSKTNTRAKMALNRSHEFKSLNQKPSAAELLGTWRPPFEQT